LDDYDAVWPQHAVFALNRGKRMPFSFAAGALFGFIILAVFGPPIADHFRESYERDLVLPTMGRLASNGKPDAVAWMVVNAPSEVSKQYESALRVAAEAGHPHSMYLYSYVLRQRHENGAQAMLERAAAQGNADAVRVLAQHKN
jgi:hypothetical protein